MTDLSPYLRFVKNYLDCASQKLGMVWQIASEEQRAAILSPLGLEIQRLTETVEQALKEAATK